MAADGGLMTLDDLAGYQIQEPEALSAAYRHLTVSVPPAPAGGVQLLQTLGILARFDLAALDHNGEEHLTLVAEAMRTALHDKEALWARPEATGADFLGLLSPEALDEAAEAVRRGERADVDAGRPPVQPHPAPHATHLNTLQADGLAVSLTHTLGNPSGGTSPGARGSSSTAA